MVLIEIIFQTTKFMLPRKAQSKVDQETEERLFQRKFVLRQKKNQKKIRMLEGKSIGKWDKKEQVKYYAFLTINQNFFEKKGMRRNDKVFKMMSKFITTRTPDQCRSHHQKIQRKLSGIRDILDNLSKQFGDINIKQILDCYKNISLETSDPSVFENQNSCQRNQDQEQLNMLSNTFKSPISENLQLLKIQQLKVDEPFLLEQVPSLELLQEEDPFTLLNF